MNLVVIGAGQRCYAIVEIIKKNHSDTNKIIGVCDTNSKRCEFYRKNINPDMKIYKQEEFDKMLDELKPDAVIVTTADGAHHEYIIRAMKKGYDVFSEKPITMSQENCLAIRRAEKQTGKKVTVTFNCRFMPYFVKLKELIASGIIGKPLAINYEYVLNTVHGGDYFKRWHRFMENSGGMMVHKATHHFDVINWLLDDDPVSVSAQGARLYFGNEDRPHGERCGDCQYKDTCESYYDDLYTDEQLKGLYFEAESEDGYQRDHCSFKGDTDIYDSMSVSVRYKKGALLTYSLNLFNTDEGYNLNIIGEKGRIEASNLFTGDDYKIIVRHRGGKVEEITFPKTTGLHDGADVRMVAMLFGGLKDDPLGQCSDSFDGVKSAMIGIAANKSIKEGIRIDLQPILDEMR